MDIDLPYQWRPRPYQMPLWNYLEKGGKEAVAVWHRRAGKDEVGLHRACVAAHERIATYWHMLPEANQARKAIWDAINPKSGKRRIDEAFPIEIRETTREQEMFIKFKCGSTWQVVGSDNYNSLIGSPPAGIVYSEWSVAKPAARAFLRPIIAENNGWELFIYTPRGRNHGLTTLEAAKAKSTSFAQVLTADHTKTLSQELLANELASYISQFGPDQGEAFFSQEYYCAFNAAILGAYYGKDIRDAEKQGRITEVPYDEGAKVYTAWDLGYHDDTAIWFYQVIGGEIHLIDFYSASGLKIEHYAEHVLSKPYRYAKHYLPHDAKAKTLSSGGKSIIEQLGSFLDYKNMAIVPDLSVQDGIQAVRLMYPRCWFDEEKTHEGIEALRQYQREYDDDKKAFKDRPRHDWTSHCADAFRYLAIAWKEEAKPEQLAKPKFWHEQTLEEMWKDTPTKSRRI
jgi:hypothetical protein